MKKFLSFILPVCTVVLFSCSKHHTVDPKSTADTGVVEIRIHLNRVGTLRKAMETTEIEIDKLIVAFSADGHPSIHDTIQLTGGMYDRT